MQPPPLPAVPDLVASSRWIGGIEGLAATALELADYTDATTPKIKADAAALAKPRLRLKTLRALARTQLRFLWFALPGVIADLTKKLFRRRRGQSSAIRRAQDMVRAGGPAYVKVGQFVATAKGIVPDDWVEAFAWCRDEVEPMPGGMAEAVIADVLGRPASELFAWFDPVPCAAASIAQAHFARLHDGTEVVVKVQRPGLRERFENDIRVMALLCTATDRLSKHARIANAPAVLEMFTQLVLGELDFQLEAFNMIHIGLATEDAGLEFVTVPRPIPGMIGPSVLVMERVYGVPYTVAKERYGDKIDGEKLLRLATQGVLEHALLYGVFHGDLHAGNVLVTEDGQISLVDFGIAGRANPYERALLVRLLIANAQQDYAAQIRIMADFGGVPAGFDFAEAERELEKYSTLFMEVADQPLDEIDFTAITGQMVGALRVLAKYRFKMPAELALFSKNMLYLNGFAAALAPKLNMFNEIEPLLTYFTDKYPTEITQILVGALSNPSAAAS